MLRAARARLTRRVRLLLIVIGCVLVLGGAFLWALPEIVRRTMVAEIPKLTGRAASIEDIDLNLFTGRLVIKKLRLAERQPSETFLEAERIALRVSPLSLVVGHLRLADLTLIAPRIRIVRTGPVEFNFSDLLALIPPAEPNRPKSRWTVSIDRLALVDGAILASDRAVSPPRSWQVQGITAEAGGLTTRAAQQPGHAEVRARVNQAPLDANAGSVVLTPTALTMRLTLDRFDLTQLRSYLPPGLPASLESGTLGVALEVAVEREEDKLKRAVVSGDVRVEGLALAQPDRPSPFVKLPRLTVAIKEADLIARSVALKSVEVEGLDLRAVRDQAGNIDLLALAGHGEAPPGRSEESKASSPPSGPSPSAGSGAALPFKATLERLTLKSGTVTVTDQAVSPTREWQIQGLTVDGAGFSTSSDDAPGTLKLLAKLNSTPGGSKPATMSVDASSVRLIPLSATARLGLEGFDLGLLGSYWPATLPALAKAGSLGVTVNAGVERGDAGLDRATVSGSVHLDALALVMRDQSTPFLTVPKLTVGVKQADLIARSVLLGSITIQGVDARAVRDATGRIDLLDLFGAASPSPPSPAPAPAPAGKPSKAAAPGQRPWRIDLDRLDFTKGAATLEDRAVSPVTTLALTDLTVTAQRVTWPSASPPASAAVGAPGALEIRGQFNSTPGGFEPATLSVDASSFRLSPLSATARLALEGFDLRLLGPYWPESLPAIVRTGSLGVTLDVGVKGGDAGWSREVASGTVRLDGLSLARRDQRVAFLALPKLTVGVKQADLIDHRVALDGVAVEGADAGAVRDAAGKIDLLELVAAAPTGTARPAAAAAPSAKPSKSPAGPGPRPWRISLDRFDFTKGTARFEDRAVSPVTTLALTDLAVTAQRVTWPSTTPGTFTVSVTMPGGGRTEVKGTGKLDPLDVQITMSTRDAPIAPYQPYFPFPARFVGFFSGDSQSEIQRAKDGKLILASRGHAWARDFEVRAPDTDAPVARMAQMDIQGLDFSWPNYALVDRVTLTQPQVQIERDSSGNINLRRLFATGENAAAGSQPPPEAPAGKPGDDKPTAAPAPRSGGPLQELVIDFKEIALEDAYIRFLDRTTTPPFSEDLSKFNVTIRGLSNQMGRQRTSLTVKASVGGDSTLSMEGQLSGIGESLRAELDGEIEGFALPAANPYAESLTSWLIDRGTLSTRFHYSVEGDRLAANHDLKFAGLRVERAQKTDESRQRIGLPLGLVVAMLKDRHGEINLSIPLHGTLSDRKFDWREAMLASARQVIVKLIVSPFSAIGRAFTSGGDKVDKLEIDPVTFAAANADIAPPMERHLTQVADFLRRAPSLKLKLTPAVSPADVEALKAHEVEARLERFQHDQRLQDLGGALRAYYMQYVPDVTLPKTQDDQLALLKKREPVPTGPLGELLKRRIDATRERLVKAEGIPAERLSADIPAAAAAAAGASGEGRVEFSIDAAQ